MRDLKIIDDLRAQVDSWKVKTQEVRTLNKACQRLNRKLESLKARTIEEVPIMGEPWEPFKEKKA